MSGHGSWYSDPGVLLDELKRNLGQAQASDPQPVIPGYVDLRKISRGGQGVVYSALQKSTNRRVAVKVLLEGVFASEASRRRFEREVEIVAGLRHPNIVQVYDSGLTADGRLYLVMEYIEGKPLDDYASSIRPMVDAASVSATGKSNSRISRRTGPELRQLLQTMATAAEAVNYAHQRGVIHRDLKPNNVLVDADGRPHILDFGLAKSLEGDGPAGLGSMMSVTGQFLGSLPWASPEQAEGHSDQVDLRTDVYSLGVVLFQITTGQFPYAVTGPMREVLNNILQAEPRKPSSLAGDIDDEVQTIILKCLAKEPSRRYQTAGELAADLRNYLLGEPIAAKRDSAWYTVRKRMQRYRIAVIAAAAVMVATIGALVVSLQALGTAEAQRAFAEEESQRAEAERAVAEQASARAEAQRVVAENESKKAAALSGFLTDMYASVDPDQDGPDVRAITLIDRAADTIEQRFAGQDELIATTHALLATLYAKLQQDQKTMDEFLEAAEAYARWQGVDSRDELRMRALAAVSPHKMGRSQEAIDLLTPIVAKQEALFGVHDRDTISSRGDLAQPVAALGRAEEAQRLLELCLEGARALDPPDPVLLARTTDRLGSVMYEMGKLEEAEAIGREAIALGEKAWKPEEADFIVLKNNVAVTLLERGKLDEAEQMFRELNEVAVRRHGEDSKIAIAFLNNLAKVMQDRQRYEDAEPLMKRVYEWRIKNLGEDHPFTMVALNNYSVNYAFQKRYDQAIPLQQKLLTLREKQAGPTHWDTLLTMNNLGASLRDAGRLEEAEAMARRARDGTVASLGPDHFASWLFEMNLGRVLTMLERYEEAEPMLVESVAKIEKQFGDQHTYTKNSRTALLKLYEATNREPEAEAIRAKLEAAAGS